jgi:transposase
MQPSSLDLRQQILQAYDQKRGSHRVLAALFGVSHAVLEQVRRRRTTGEIAPRPHAGGRQARCDAAALAFVRRVVREQPDATLEELGAQLWPRRGLPLRVATRGRVLQRLELPRQKRLFMPMHAPPRGASRPVPPTGSRPPGSIFGACSVSLQPAAIWR